MVRPTRCRNRGGAKISVSGAPPTKRDPWYAEYHRRVNDWLKKHPQCENIGKGFVMALVLNLIAKHLRQKHADNEFRRLRYTLKKVKFPHTEPDVPDHIIEPSEEPTTVNGFDFDGEVFLLNNPDDPLVPNILDARIDTLNPKNALTNKFLRRVYDEQNFIGESVRKIPEPLKKIAQKLDEWSTTRNWGERGGSKKKRRRRIAVSRISKSKRRV